MQICSNFNMEFENRIKQFEIDEIHTRNDYTNRMPENH